MKFDTRARQLTRTGRLIVAIALIAGLMPAHAFGVERDLAIKPYVMQDVGGDDATPDVLVKVKPGTARESVRDLGRVLGYRMVREIPGIGWSVLRPLSRPSAAVAADLKTSELFMQVELDQQAEIATAPNDPYYSTQWALSNTGQTGGTPGVDISAPGAWDVTTGSRDVVVAVVDTGVNLAHEDLAANAWVNTAEIPGNGIDDDLNGYVDDVNGWDFTNRDSTYFDVFDGDKHGTHVAGIIGAVGDNAIGVAGVNWNVSIMACKFITPSKGPVSSGAEAIVYAVDNGADVINHSWGTTGYSAVLEDALRYARERGVINVVAAGNTGGSVDVTPMWPAAIEATNVVTVAATDHNDALATFSSYGVNLVDVAAPGVNVTSTIPAFDAGYFITRNAYKIAYFGFPLETAADQPTRRSMLAWSLHELAGSTTAPILIVDDSHAVAAADPFDRITTYLTDLAALGYSDIQVHNTEFDGVPGIGDLNGRAVIWFTGQTHSMPGPIGSLGDTERAVIGTYLDNGGRLLMSSGAIAQDLDYVGIARPWFREYFRSACVGVETWSASGEGVAGGPFAGLRIEIPAGEYESNGYYASSDDLTPLDPSAVPLVRWSGYAPLSGTSMATPAVAGALALARAAHPDESAEELRARVESTLEPVPALATKVSTGGRLDLDGLLDDYAAPPQVLFPADGDTLHRSTVATALLEPRPGTTAGVTYEAQIGIPTEQIPSGGFESGTLSGWSADSRWTLTTDPDEVFAGTWAARTRNVTDNTGAQLARSVVTPAGGGWVSFRYWLDSEDGYDWAFLYTTGTGGNRYRWVAIADSEWQRVNIWLPEGSYVLYWYYIKDSSGAEGKDAFGLDEISLASHTWSDVGQSVPGSNEITFTVPDVETRSAAFRVRALDGGSPGAWETVRYTVLTADATPPASPESLSALADEDGRVALGWTNPVDVDWAYTRVVRSLIATPAGPGDGVTVYEGRGTTVTDSGLPHGTVAYYSAFAADGATNWSPGVSASATVSDITPPPPVGLLQATRSGEDVALSWMNPLSEDFAGVRVVRRENTPPLGPADPAAELVYTGTGITAVDVGAAAPGIETQYYYGAWTFDHSGNYSSAKVASITVDTRAPEGTFLLAGGASYVATRSVAIDSSVTGATEMRFDVGEGFSAWEPYAGQTEVILTDGVGAKTVSAQYRDGAGNVLELEGTVIYDPDAPGVDRLSGASRYETALVVSATTFVSAGTVVLANGVGYADALGASGLAGAYGGPVLLTPRDGIPSGLLGELERLGARDVIVIGGTKAISVDVDMALQKAGYYTRRIQGADRYATAAAVAAETLAVRESTGLPGTVFVARGDSFADALALSPLAYSARTPVLLVTRDSVPTPTSDAIAAGGFTRAVVAGGTGAVSDAVADSLAPQVERLAGADRYDTAAVIAGWGADEQIVSWRRVGVATGASFADALGGGPALGEEGGVMLLSRRDELPSATAAAIQAHSGEIVRVHILGGSGAISQSVATSIGGLLP